ncbi:hypothetical protein GDO81_028115 [Engystomops pustulosus]|uniref:Uncharacterized protein n=1 Tax=Engystomops pustulosus TaxID=76066 RepID=A0AAV6ZDR9_ENGPU|nr:hypothetical protein GDO81_028115 [Engystomops pustulosus]KAG8547520.1 hypothetical protein GDO81_028115 [Engystomops pustulosus]
MTYEYFQEDLLYIVENWRNQSLLLELISRNIPHVEKYMSLEHDGNTLARTLLQDIFRRGREAVITLWVSLHALRKDHGSPVLDAVLEELGHRGNIVYDMCHSSYPGLIMYNDLSNTDLCTGSVILRSV